MADDTRVVQMQFDNKNFERNIGTSQKSLERFKSALNFDAAAKGLKTFGDSIKNLAFDSLVSNVEKLADKFTGWGNVAEYVISRVRGQLEQLGDKALGFLDDISIGQMSAGFAKYETLNKSVQTLKSATGKTEEEIYATLDKLNWYTDQTSYDFSEGVTSISKLVSSGAADLETAEKTIEGFYNMAAKAGADTQTATHALQYSLTQAMSLGYMGRNDWKTLESTSLATIDFKTQLLEAGVALGNVTKEGDKYYVMSKKGKKAKKVEVNATNLWNESLQEQWVTSKVLNKALANYADTTQEFGAEAFAAAQRCTTFTDALNAWKDMMSTGWMQAYRTVFGDLGDAMALFSGLCDKVSEGLDGVMSSINATLNAWREIGGRDNLWGFLFGEITTPDGEVLFENAYGILDIITEFGNLVSEGFWNTIMNLIPADEQKKIVDLVNSQWKALGLEKPFESFQELYNSDWFKETGGREGLLGGALQGATENIQNFVKGIHEWFTEIDDNGVSRLQKIQNVMNAIGRTIAFIFEILGGVGHFFGLIAKQLGPSTEAIGNLLSNLGLKIIDAENDASNSGAITGFFEKLANVLSPVTEIINEVVLAITGLISSIVTGEEETGAIGGTLEKVGRVIKKIFSIIMSVAKPITTFLSEAFGILGKLFENGFDEKSLADAKEKLIVAFNKMWDGLKSAVKPLIDKIGSLISAIWEEIKEKLKAYFSDENSLGHKILEPIRKIFGPIWETIKEVFTKIKNALTGAGSDTAEGGKTLFQVLTDVLTPIFEKLKTVNLGTLIKMFLGGLVAFKLIKSIKSGSKLVGGLTDLLENLKDPFKWLKESFLGAKGEESSFTDKIWTFAKSIGVLAAALLFVGNMKWDELARGLVGLGGILLMLVGYMALLKLLKIDGSMLKGFAAFTVSIGILVLSMKTFANMSWDQFGKMMAGLGGVLLQMVAVMELMNLLKVDTRSLGGFISFALSITILVLTLKTFANMSWEQFGKMMAGLGGVLLQLIGVMLLTSYLPIGTGQLGGFIKFALSITILVLTLQTAANMSWEQIGKMMAGLGGILLELVVFMGLMKLFKADTSQLNQMSIFAGVIAGVLTVLQPLTNMEWEHIGKMLAGMGGILLELAVFMGLMKLFKGDTSSMGGFLAFAISIGALVFLLKPLAEQEWEDLAKMVSGLGVLILEMLLFMHLTSKMKGIDKKGMAMMLIASVSLGIIALAFGGALKKIKGMKWDAIAAFALGISVAMIAMAGTIAILSKVDFASGIKGIALLAVAIAAIAGVISLMAPIVGNSLGTAMESVCGYLALAGNSIKRFTESMSGVGDLDSVKEKIGTIVEIVQSLSGIRNLQDDINAFSSMVFTLGVGVGLMQYSMAGVEDPSSSNGIKMMEKLLAMKDQLNEFSGAVNGYLIAAKFNSIGAGLKRFSEDTAGITFNEDESQGFALLQKLSEMANGLDTISKINFTPISGKLSELGGAMKLYAEGAGLVKNLGVDGDDIPDVSAATSLLQAIVQQLSGETGELTLPKLPPVGNENTEGSISCFGAQLVALGGGLTDFANACTGMDESKTKLGLDALDFIMKIKERLTDQLIEAVTFFGDQGMDATSLAGFGADLTALAGGLHDFLVSCEGIGDNTQKGLDALDYFMVLKDKLFNQRAEILEFVEEWNSGKSDDETITAESIDDFSNFGVQIGALGKALSSFAQEVNFDPEVEEKFNNGIKTLDFLVTLRGRMPYIGGLKQFITGYQETFKELAKDIGDLGTSIGSFGRDIVSSDGFKDTETIERVTAAVELVNSLVSILSNLGTLWGAFSGPHSQNFLGDALQYSEYYAAFIKQFLINLEEMNYTETANRNQTGGFSKFTEKLAGILRNFNSALKDMDLNEALTASQILANVSQAIGDLITVSRTAGEEGSQVDFSEIGLNISAGVALGIENGTSDVINAAIAMVQAAKDAAMETAKEASPSKVFMEIGEYMSIGTAIGLSNETSSVEKAASGMAEEAIDEASRMMALITSLMSQEFEADPTITPVLDLANITAGAQTINDILGENRDMSLTVDGNRYARNALPRSDQGTREYTGPDLSWVQSSIDNLGNRIDAMASKISSMQIVLNTGALVGGVTDGVNKNLGQKATYGRRRN